MAAAVVLHLCRHWKLRQSTACSYHVIPHANAFQSLISLSRWAVGQSRWQKFDKVQFLILKGAKGASPRSRKSPSHSPSPAEQLSVSLRTPSLLLIPLGAIPSFLYTFGNSATRRSALLTDLLALSFSHNALSLLKLDSFKTGCVLLSGLFIYDIWWVFGTEVVCHLGRSVKQLLADIHSDGKSGHLARRSHQNPLAKIYGVFH